MCCYADHALLCRPVHKLIILLFYSRLLQAIRYLSLLMAFGGLSVFLRILSGVRSRQTIERKKTQRNVVPLEPPEASLSSQVWLGRLKSTVSRHHVQKVQDLRFFFFDLAPS